jgi:hypothetical protein
VTRAFVYLVLVTTRNRLASQARRLRNPRYALALLLGLGYFWMVFLRRGMRGSSDINLFSGLGAATVLPVVLLMLTTYAWLSGGDKFALAFSEAEVAMLFPAPVSRRGLIVYKLVRSQSAILFTSLVWSVIFRGGRGGITAIVGYWMFLSVIALHRLGVALVYAANAEHGVKGLRRTWPAIVVFTVAAAAIGHGLYEIRGDLDNATGFENVMQIVSSALSTGALGVVFYPFRVAVAPMVATTAQQWATALPPAFVLIALHVWWVLRSDTAFEETAAAASAAQAQRIQTMRARGVSGATVNTKARRRSIRLRPTGAPAVALLWKNVLWLVRTGQVRTLVGLPLIAVVAAVGFGYGAPDMEPVVAGLCMGMVLTVLLFGPMTMRNDLRGELRRLPMLKTLPLPGRQIILAEVTSSAGPTAAVQYLLLAAAVLAISLGGKGVPPLDLRVGVLLGAPLLVLGLNLANFTIHNGIALLLPAWVRLGETGGGSVELMGQMMLTMLATLLMLALLLIGPGLVGAGIYFAARSLPLVGIAAAGVVGGALLSGEAYLLMRMLGGSLERLEPMQVG